MPKNINQKKYLKFIAKNDIVFGVGPAGTGKTYLAVAHGPQGASRQKVEKVILTRPAVEAGKLWDSCLETCRKTSSLLAPAL